MKNDFVDDLLSDFEGETFVVSNSVKDGDSLGTRIEEKVFGVAEFSNVLKTLLEVSFNKIKVKGEIQGLKKHSSGTYYFDLKENVAGKDYILNCVLWRYTKINVKLEEGLEVVLTGKVTAYTGRSSYQITVENVEIAGVGALLKIIEERKNRLLKEGLFDAKYKKPIPFLPSVVGVITSETGAVIRDILHRISDRCPIRVILYPVLVQGDGADEQITEAIYNFNKIIGKDRPDVIIVARGGGSVQDLMPFNEENVVRAVFASEIPIISAVGHETDTTLIDYVSDLRAPTPTGAAEKVVPVRSELLLKLSEKELNLSNNILKKIEYLNVKLMSFYNALKSPVQLLRDNWQRIDDKSSRLDFIMKTRINEVSEKLSYLGKMLNSYSFKNVLSRGFSIIWNNGNIISSSKDVKNLSDLKIEFYDGKVSINDKFIKSKKVNIGKLNSKQNLLQEELF